MSISITEPTRKNVSTQFEAQAPTEVSSTIGGQDVKFTINRPNKFKTPTVSDSQELDDILSTALIHLKADGHGFTAGQDVTTWTNSGTGGSTYDAENQGDPIFDANYPPSFETSGHPFSSFGAIKIDTITGTSYTNESLVLSNEFSQTDSFVLFLVVHEPEQGLLASGYRGMATPAFGFLHGKATKPFTESDHAVRFGTLNPTTGPAKLTMDAEKTTTTPTSRGNYAFSYGGTDAFDRYGNRDVVPPVTNALVVRVDKDKVAHLYNSRAQGLVDPSETPPLSFVGSGPSFANVPTWKWQTIGFSSSYTWEGSGGDGSAYSAYIATIGAFDTDLGDQQCRALARLLAEKYQIS
jgi:hypothetical protein